MEGPQTQRCGAHTVGGDIVLPHAEDPLRDRQAAPLPPARGDDDAGGGEQQRRPLHSHDTQPYLPCRWPRLPTQNHAVLCTHQH